MATSVHPALKRLRALSASLPETAEGEAWGHPTFRAGKKIFATFGLGPERASITVKQTIPDQTLLLEQTGYFKPAYVGHKGWVGMDVDVVAWDEVEELVVDSYRQVALKRMLKALDAEG